MHYRNARTINATFTPGDRTRAITVVVPIALYDVLERMAQKEDMSKSELVRELLLQVVTLEKIRVKESM